MEAAIEYRGLAAKLKREAAMASLPNVRELKLEAAHRWESMAEEIEMVVMPGKAHAMEGWIF